MNQPHNKGKKQIWVYPETHAKLTAIAEIAEVSVADIAQTVTNKLSKQLKDAVYGEKKEADLRSVILEDAGNQTIQVIKVVRQITGKGLKEAKEDVDNVPRTLAIDHPVKDANQFKQMLEEVGAKVRLE